MKDYEIYVRTDAELVYRVAPANIEESILREQANVKIKALARRFDKGLAIILEALAKSDDDD